MEEGRDEYSSFSDSVDNSAGNVDRDGGLSGCFFLDHVGEVLLSRNHDGLSWKCLDSSDCVRFMLPQVHQMTEFVHFRRFKFIIIFLQTSVVCVCMLC